MPAQDMMANVLMLAGWFGGGELMVVLVVGLVVLGSKRIPESAHGLRQALDEFFKASKGVLNEFDQAGFDAGKSLGGIHGKPAFEAITVDNQNVELYDPSVIQENSQTGKNAGQESHKTKWKVARLLAAIISCLVGKRRLNKTIHADSNGGK